MLFLNYRLMREEIRPFPLKDYQRIDNVCIEKCKNRRKMKRLSKILATIMAVGIMAISTGCRQSEIVTHNVVKEADYFNVARRIVVINARTDAPLFELKGYFALSNNSESELVITCEVGVKEYQVHYVYLNEWTMYVVERLDSSVVSKYQYEIWYMPESILPSISPTD